jgi:hypothetical protein
VVSSAKRAGTAITGSYYAVGDSVELRARLVDVRSGRVLATVGPLRAPRADTRPALDELCQRASGGVSVLTDTLLGAWALPAGQPPTYKAYQELAAGLELFFGGRPASKGDAGVDEIVAHFARAAALDTTYLQAQLWLAWYHTVWLFKVAKADSALRPLEQSRDRLSPFEDALVDALRATINGDVLGGVGAWQRLAAATPLPYFKLRYVRALLVANRPREALRVVQATSLGSRTDEQLYWWETVAQIHHYLGDHQAELAAARAARRVAPQSLLALLDEVYPLAAAGRVAELEALAQEAPSLPYDPRDEVRVGDVFTVAALELRAHGHTAAAARFLDRAIAWFGSRPPLEHDDAFEYAARYAAGHWREASQLAARALATDSDNVFLRGLVGRTAARLGDRATAERISRELATPGRLGSRAYGTLERAKIAAVLGDRERALSLVVDAFAQGLGWAGRSLLHEDVDFESLRDDSTFRRLLEPQG